MITIPKFFHELLGEEQSRGSLACIVAFVLITGTVVGVWTFDHWITLPLLQQLIVWLLYADIAGGVIANLTRGTDVYYANRPRARWVFIALHVQPFILIWALQVSWESAVLIWLYTILAAVILNFCRKSKYQRELAGCLLGLGLIILVYVSQSVPHLAAVLYALYLFKVIYSFSVQHVQVSAQEKDPPIVERFKR
jgi:hypothetical protein